MLRPLQVITNMIVSVSESHFGLQISQPPNITQKWFCIQNLHMDLSFQKKKNGVEIRSLVLEISNKQTFEHFFLNALYLWSVLVCIYVIGAGIYVWLVLVCIYDRCWCVCVIGVRSCVIGTAMYLWSVLVCIWAVFPSHNILLLQLKKISIYDPPVEVLPHY